MYTMRKLNPLPLAIGALCLCFLPHYSAFAEEGYDFGAQIRPILDKYCIECHNPDNLRGDLNLDRFTTPELAADALDTWERAARRVQDGEMPPNRAEHHPSEDERELLLAWIGALEPPDGCNQIASEESVNWYPGFVMSRRLNRAEYENSIRDLFGMEIPVAHFFPADGAGGEGFDNSGNTLFLSAIQLEKYLEAADYVVETALPSERPGESANPLPTPEDRHQYREVRNRLITHYPSAEQSAYVAAAQTLENFLFRAWRRPVEPRELHKFLGLFDEAQSRGDSYIDSLKLAIKGALVSPHFIFLAEPEPEERGDYPLGGYPLASRLSYFFWASMPDEELFRLAADGTLQQDDVLRRQVDRMLKDDKAGALGRIFASQWLGIVELGDARKPDTERFPEFDAGLLVSMKREPELVFNRIVQENRSLLELIDSDYTYVDQRLAEIYGIDGVNGEGMQLVQLASAARGGVLGMSAILTTTSHPLRTSPVLRGKWVLEQLLGDRVPPPPPDAGTLPEDDHNTEGLSLREQLELHRRNPDCASCHNRMDPLGFGLENFDPIGRWREFQAGQPIDTQGVLPSGESFNGPEELKVILLAQKEAFANNLSKKMLGYALGRSLTRDDLCVVDDAMDRLRTEEYRPLGLFQEIVLSYPFRYRYSGGKLGSTEEDGA